MTSVSTSTCQRCLLRKRTRIRSDLSPLLFFGGAGVFSSAMGSNCLLLGGIPGSAGVPPAPGRARCPRSQERKNVWHTHPWTSACQPCNGVLQYAARGDVPKRPKGAVCKTAIRGFESRHHLHFSSPCSVSTPLPLPAPGAPDLAAAGYPCYNALLLII